MLVENVHGKEVYSLKLLFWFRIWLRAQKINIDATHKSTERNVVSTDVGYLSKFLFFLTVKSLI